MTDFVTALLVKPGETPQKRKISPDFNSMRRIIGANAEETYPFADAVAVVYDPDGDALRLPLNVLLKNGSGQPYGTIHGAFLLVGVDCGEYVSLTERQTRRFREMFNRERVSSEKPCSSLESAVSAFKRRGQPALSPAWS
jgi:hypothetical protein